MAESQSDITTGFRIPAGSGQGAAAAFRRHGFVILDGLWPSERIDRFSAALESHCPEVLDLRQGELDQSQRVSDLRFITPLVFGEELPCADMVLEPLINSVLLEYLGSDYVIESFGLIGSHPGAPNQGKHRDGTLFNIDAIDQMLPPFAIAVGIPLAQMDEVSGTTGFWPGSHRLAEFRTAENAQMVSPVVPVGSALLRDFRTLHRCLANRGDRARPVLYATFCRRFWADYENFERGRDVKLMITPQALDTLDETQKHRFSRARLCAAGDRPWK